VVVAKRSAKQTQARKLERRDVGRALTVCSRCTSVPVYSEVGRALTVCSRCTSEPVYPCTSVRAKQRTARMLERREVGRALTVLFAHGVPVQTSVPVYPHTLAAGPECLLLRVAGTAICRLICFLCSPRHRMPMPVSTSTRGLHSSTFRLNLSALYGTAGGARRGCVARVKGVLAGV